MPAPLRIGPLVIDPPVLQAPMAGYTNFAFRQIVRGFGGAGLLCTEMVSARAWRRVVSRGGPLPQRLWGVKDEPRPLAVQIWDNDPEALAEVARGLIEQLGVSVIDLNFGCPAKAIADKASCGAHLLRDPVRVGQIVERVVAACRPVPVTAKIRLGPCGQQITAVEVAQAVEAAGAAAITVHGRTAQQMYRGQANWERIAEVKARVSRLPVIGNGDLCTAEHVVKAFARYGVDGVMIGRAALGRPWLFRQIAAALRAEPVPPDPSPDEQCRVLREHYRLIVQWFGPRKGTTLMRKYACQYARGCPGARAFRAQVAKISSPEEFESTLPTLFPRNESTK